MKRLTSIALLTAFTIALIYAMPAPAETPAESVPLTVPVMQMVHIAVQSEQAAPPVPTQPAYSIADAELLARLLYAECRGESREGQLMVAQVPLDRLARGDWGDTLESVIYWPNQFAKPGELTEELLEVAIAALTGERFSEDEILYFRATKSTKDWYAGYLGHVGGHAYYGNERDGE